MKSPVLFLVFNRPESTRRVFEAIRSAKPPRLYIAADGPRPGRAGEAARCEEVRAIAAAVDWPCEKKTLFRTDNLGCKLGVAGGISWFFEHEAEGVILEDDVLPVASFFEYCDQLLEHYRNDERIGAISGCNLISHLFSTDDSYFFSRYNHIWGWATWRRAWQDYDVEMQKWPDWRKNKGLEQMAGAGRFFSHYWRNIFDKVYAGKIDTWDYQWTFACWRTGRLTVLPKVNQTENLGFGPDATHTIANAPDYVEASKAQLLGFPLRHPSDVSQALTADALIDSCVFGITFSNMLRHQAHSYPVVRSIFRVFKRLVGKNAAS